MTRTNALLVSLAVGLAAVAGVFALGRTLALSTHSHAASDRLIARRTAQLDRYEASLRKELAKKPPALPPRPASGSAAVQSAAPVRVVYHRPPPVVVVRHRSGEHEDGAEGIEADD